MVKKLLNILGSVLISSSFVPKVLDKESIENKKAIKDDFLLNVPVIQQETAYYCVPASIQAIFSFFDVNINEYTQTRIYNELLQRDPDNIGPGIHLSQDVADYMTGTIESTSENIVIYNYNYLGYSFGSTITEIRLFQNYVYESLRNSDPLLFSYRRSGEESGHALIINGIEISLQNPWWTQYRYINPADGTLGTLFGYSIPAYTTQGGEIIGYSSIPSEDKLSAIELGIDEKKVGKSDLNDYELHKVLELKTDITGMTNFRTTGSFRDAFSWVSLSDFYGEIYKFNDRIKVRDFNLETSNLPDDCDYWKGSEVEIMRASEDIGTAHIEGRIVAQLQFEFSSIKHLIMTLIIYVGGIAWLTWNYAHVWIMTGTILSFIKNEEENKLAIVKTDKAKQKEIKKESSLNNLNINIKSFSKMDNNIASDGGKIKWLGDTDWIDLTAFTGVTGLYTFKFIYKYIEFPDFQVGIGLFSYAKGKTALKINISDWPTIIKKDWVSDFYTQVEGNETSGSAQIYGWIGIKFWVFYHPILNHLMFKIAFFASGSSSATPTIPWGQVKTGDILRFKGN
ncbi:MAG: C39 family peptidase [Spiroplasma sp.]